MGSEQIGDNIEFTAAAIGEYIIYFNQTGTDTEFAKYPDNPNVAYKFQIRTDKNADLIGMNDITFTDPCQITADKAHIETSLVFRASWIKIRTNSTNTMIKVRWF